MMEVPYTHGLHDLGNGIYAYLQPDGSWGLNNAGLVKGADKVMLVDTLYDLPRTRKMLADMAAAEPRAETVDILVNTHVNGDHCFGNQLLTGAEIVATDACAAEFATETPPELMKAMLDQAPAMGPLGKYVSDAFGRFQYDGITLTPPTRTFSGELPLDLGDRQVVLIEVGPCHTRGDAMVWVPDAKALFAGDILFIGGTPIMWDGPVANWIAACEKILSLGAETIVPGHGPVCGPEGVKRIIGYWKWLGVEARRHFDAGHAPLDAAKELMAGPYAHWGDPERTVINVDAFYREFRGAGEGADRIALLTQMAGIKSK
jgi:cyclase